MKRFTGRIGILSAVLLGALLVPAGARPDRRAWTATNPPVNETHIFQGEINRRGKPVGFHARPGGTNPPRARVVRIIQGPNRLGVYTAEVEIRNGEGRWLRKTSTFYPDTMKRDEVIAAILNAWRRRAGGGGGGEKFRGPSGRGFTIEGYFQNGRINTAWPVFQR